MEVLFNRHWTCTVKRKDDKLLVEAYYLDTGREMSLHLVVAVSSFVIEDAWTAVYRSRYGEDRLQLRKISDLVGLVAYFDAGGKLQQIRWQNEGERLLTAECIRGVIQAETFLVKERGFVSEEAYDAYWREMYGNSCRYYSNLERVQRSWQEYVADQQRYDSVLYTRSYVHTIFKEENQYLFLSGMFSDSFHELNMGIKLDEKNGSIISAWAQMLRGPDTVCREGMGEAVNLNRKKISELENKKEVARLLGGTNGCVHLIDLTSGLLTTLRLHRLLLRKSGSAGYNH